MWCSQAQTGKSFNAVVVCATGAAIAAVFGRSGKIKPEVIFECVFFLAGLPLCG